ncbi:DUF1465 family protein [Sphingomonas sp. DT-51]|uniref:DUF1465 family protein n=1 Tax=Sphingomonas sp. DT-51 TaxID=3396165 RepID=UPI003F19FF11
MAQLLDAEQMQRRLIDTVYMDAMVLADEARHYFDEGGRAERESLTPIERVTFSCESLKVTTRLMHVIAWLLTQRAVIAGELSAAQAIEPGRRLGAAPPTAASEIETLPERARAMIMASSELHRRVERLDRAQLADAPMASPARSMLDRLATAF